MKIKTCFSILILLSSSLFSLTDSEHNIYNGQYPGLSFKYPMDLFITAEGYWNSEDETRKTYYIDISKYETPPPSIYEGIRITIGTFTKDLYKYVTSGYDDELGEYYLISVEEIKYKEFSGYQVIDSLGTSIYLLRDETLVTISSTIPDDTYKGIFNSINFVE